MAVTYPLEGANAVLQSISAAGTDIAAMISTAASTTTGSAIPYDIQIALDAPVLNITAMGASSVGNRVGLRSWTATIKARYPRVQRSIGATGLVYIDGGTTPKAFIKSWNINVNAAAMDISSLNQTDRTWKYFRPSKLISWNGSFDCEVDQGTAVVGLESPATALASYAGLQLDLIDEGTAGEANDPTLSGLVMLNQLGHSMPMGDSQLQMLRYAFTGTGDLTAANGSVTAAIFPAGAVVQPIWDANADGAPDVTLTFYVDGTTSRTYAGTCFWTSVSASASVDGLIDVTIGLQGTGPLVIV